MSDAVCMIIKCHKCGNWWNVDHDPDSCTCADDLGWELFVAGSDDE